MFNNAAKEHKSNQLLNPFSATHEPGSPRPKFSKEEYGKWVSHEIRTQFCTENKPNFFRSLTFCVLRNNKMCAFSTLQTSGRQLNRGSRTKSQHPCVPRDARAVPNDQLWGLFALGGDAWTESHSIRWTIQRKLNEGQRTSDYAQSEQHLIESHSFRLPSNHLDLHNDQWQIGRPVAASPKAQIHRIRGWSAVSAARRRCAHIHAQVHSRDQSRARPEDCRGSAQCKSESATNHSFSLVHPVYVSCTPHKFSYIRSSVKIVHTHTQKLREKKFHLFTAPKGPLISAVHSLPEIVRGNRRASQQLFGQFSLERCTTNNIDQYCKTFSGRMPLRLFRFFYISWCKVYVQYF